MSRKKRKRVDRQRRRKARETGLLAAKETLPRSQPRRSFFRAKARKGDALAINFVFSELAVPFEDWKDPSKGVLERYKILKSQMERLDYNIKN
jgi:hypothetical protein